MSQVQVMLTLTSKTLACRAIFTISVVFALVVGIAPLAKDALPAVKTLFRPNCGPNVIPLGGEGGASCHRETMR